MAVAIELYDYNTLNYYMEGCVPSYRQTGVHTTLLITYNTNSLLASYIAIIAAHFIYS